MDRNWIKAHRLSTEYKDGVDKFCEHAAKNAKNISFILCPCKKCLNVIEVNGLDQLKEHLMFHGIDKTYTCWTYHGEKKGEPSSRNLDFDYQFVDTIETDVMEDTKGDSSSVEKDIPNMINDELRDHPDMHEGLKDAAALPLWPGCTNALVSFRTRCGKTYTKTAQKTFKWTNIQCPKQAENDGIFCGHYVGCFVEDVLRSSETSITVNFTRSNRLMCYSPDKMFRFRDNWVGFLYNRFLKGKLLKM